MAVGLIIACGRNKFALRNARSSVFPMAWFMEDPRATHWGQQVDLSVVPDFQLRSTAGNPYYNSARL